MNFFILIVLMFFLNPVQCMEAPKNESSKDNPKNKLMLNQGELRVFDVSKDEFRVQLHCSQVVTITKEWKHWWDGWRGNKKSFPLVCLDNDKLLNMRSEGICKLSDTSAPQSLSILCPIIATFAKKEANSSKKYDVCIVGKYDLHDHNYSSKSHVTSGKITRMKFKLSHDNSLQITSYSRYGDSITKLRQILNVNTFEELVPTAIITQWKKTQSP